MTIDLSATGFTNGFYSSYTEAGNIILLNAVDEDFNEQYTLSGRECVVRQVLAEYVLVDPTTGEAGAHVSCTNVIGLEDDYISIGCDDTSLYGQILTPDNVGLCTITIKEGK